MPMPSSPPSFHKSRHGIPSFETKLENEEEILDALLFGLSKNQLDDGIWLELHEAAVRHDRVSELAFAYESVAQGRRLKTLVPLVQAELFYRAAGFFGEVLGDEFGATTYLERALTAWPAHAGAFKRIDAHLTRVDDNKKLADLCVYTATHRNKPDQLLLLKRAAILYERANLEDKAIETYQQLVKLDPTDEPLRSVLEARYVKANRYRDVARMFEQALAADPPPDVDDTAQIRAKLVEVFANQLKEPERAMPHVEALLDVDPTHPEARRVALRLLESKGLAARSAAALASGAPTTEEAARYLAIELENTRGPRRRDVLRRIGILKQDELNDPQGALDAFEQALGIDPTEDDLRRRYVALGSTLKGPLDVARTFARISTAAKDASVRSLINAEMGELLLLGGDAKRARTALVGVLTATGSAAAAILVASRALTSLYEAENDAKNLVEVLSRVAELSNDDSEKQQATERIAQLCTTPLGDIERAIDAWRRLVDSPARERAFEALEPLYEKRESWLDLSFVLEQRARGLAAKSGDSALARQLSFRAAEVLTHLAKDITSAAEAWRQLVETYGPARDIYAQWIPLLELQRQWPELAAALSQEAQMAPLTERSSVLSRLGLVHLTRTRDYVAAIDAFKSALDADPADRASRGALEKLLSAGEHRLAAALVLEPAYRRDEDSQGLLRVLDIKARLSAHLRERLVAIDEAAVLSFATSRDKALDLVGKGLAEAVTGNEPIQPWLERFDAFAGDTDPKRRAAILGKGLGEHPISSSPLAALAERVGSEHAASGDLGAALVALRRALSFEPSSLSLLSRIDGLLRESGNPEERVALFRAALERGPDAARRGELLHSIGSIERYELRNLEAALGVYRQALGDNASDQIAYDALVELLSEVGAWSDLCDILEAHLPIASSPEEARGSHARIAEIASAHGQHERAGLHARALLHSAEAVSSDLDLVEHVAIVINDVDLLRLVLERRVAHTTDPRQQSQGLERIATLDLASGDSRRAVEHLKQAAEIARSSGDEATLVALLVRVRECNPRDIEATAQLVDLYERTGNYARTRALLDVLLEVAGEPSERVSLFRRQARLLAEHAHDLPGAFAAAANAFALAPCHRGVLAEFETLARRTGDVEAFALAIAAASKGLHETAEVTLAMARVLATQPASHADAARAYRTVIETAADEPNRAAAALGLRSLLEAMPPSEGRNADVRWLAAWHVENARPADRSRALTSWAALEETLLKNPTRALELYKDVLANEADDLDALGSVTRLSLSQGDLAGALTALTTRHATSEGEVRQALAVQIATLLVGCAGREREALPYLASVLDASPDDSQALELAAVLLSDVDIKTEAAALLDTCLDAVCDPVSRAAILRRLLGHGEPGIDFRLGHYERLLDIYADLDNTADAFDVVVRAARELPHHAALWDRAETLARKLSSPDSVAALYEEVLRRPLDGVVANDLGQRAVAFFEEWLEDSVRVVGILERLLEIDPLDNWAFDRLKLIFDAQERWDDLFALYDRTAARAEAPRRLELLEEAAQIAKDFANHSKRAIGYLEQLLALKPGTTRIEAALERLYERHGFHRELIGLLGERLPQLTYDEAQRERARMANLWLDELSDASSALIVIEDILAHQNENENANERENGRQTADVNVRASSLALPSERMLPCSLPPPLMPALDVTALLERVLAKAPHTAEVRPEVMRPAEGRRDSYAPKAKAAGLVRQRAAALLRARYEASGMEENLARALEVELEGSKTIEERTQRHHQIAVLYAHLGDDERAMEHFIQLVLLEPTFAAHRTELARLAESVGRFERLADVLVSAADACAEDTLKVDLLMQAGVVTTDKLKDPDRAIDIFFRILATAQAGSEAKLAACRKVEPLLETAGRKSDRLDVLERLALLEERQEERFRVLGAVARLATELHENPRAIWAWEGRLETAPHDREALDGLVVQFEEAQRWQPLIDVLTKRDKLDRPAHEQRADRIRIATLFSEKLEAPEEAITAWVDVEATFGHEAEGTRALAALYRATRRWSDLAELFAQAARRTENAREKASFLRDLGDIQRTELAATSQAVESYESALRYDARSEGSRAGLRALLEQADHRADVVRVLLLAFRAADDWRLVLDLTEHRLNAATNGSPTHEAEITILLEAATLAEVRAQDAPAAFAFVRRAFMLDPSCALVGTLDELFRLAEATRSFRSLADALLECVSSPEAPSASWSRDRRFRLGEVLETRLEEPETALDAYVHTAHDDPTDLVAAAAVLRVAGRTARWDAAAVTLVESTRACARLEPELLEAATKAATTSSDWDALTSCLTELLRDGGGLEPPLARDMEASLAVWHRERRGDPDSAEAAYVRALTYDSANSGILAELTKLQRRANGRPLVDSLVRLSDATGGDLDLLREAADVARGSVGDRALSKAILEKLRRLAVERWTGSPTRDVPGEDHDGGAKLAFTVSSGTPAAPETYVERAATELKDLYESDGDDDKVISLLVETASLPWSREKSRSLRHDAARFALERLNAEERAKEIYLQLIAEDPQDTRAIESLVRLYLSAGQKTELRALKRGLVETARTQEERLALRLEVAHLEDELGDAAKAATVLLQNLEESPRNEATRARLEALFTRDEQYSQLEELLAQQATLAENAFEPTAAADLHQRAAEIAEVMLGSSQAATRHLRRVIDLEERPAALDSLARLATAAGDYPGAASYLDKLRERTLGPSREAVALRLADAQLASGLGAAAQATLEAEVALYPEGDRVRMRLASAYNASEAWGPLAELLTDGARYAVDKATRFGRLREAADLHRTRTGQPERAIPLLEQATDLAPEDNTIKLLLADAFGAADRFDDARALLRALVEAFGGRRPKERAPVHYHLARLDLRVGERAQALVELDAATRIDPANPEILHTLAELARDDGQLDRAERSYRALLTVLRRHEPLGEDAPISRSEVMFELSKVATLQGEPERAKEVLESAFEIASESALEGRRLEASLRTSGDFVSLVRALEARIMRGGTPPDAAALYNELGHLYEERLGRADDAFEMHVQAIEVDSACGAAHDAALRLGKVLGKSEGYNERVRALAEAELKTHPARACALFVRLGAFAEADGKDDREAARLYERAAAADSRDRSVLAALDLAYERLGDYGAQARVLGVRVALDTEDSSPSSDVLYRLVQLLFRGNDVDAACNAFEQAFAADADSDRAQPLMRVAAEAHPASERVVDILERLARESGRPRELVDALVRRWALPTSSTAPMREAVEIASVELSDRDLTESLLRRYLEGIQDDKEGRVWALAKLAGLCEEAGNVREAVVLKREAADLSEPADARRLLYDVAGLASGPLSDLRLAGSVYEELHGLDPVDRDAWELLLDVYRRTDDFEKLGALLQEVVGYVDDSGERSKLRLERVRVGMEKLKLSDDDAAVALREIVDEDPAQVDGAILLVAILERSGREEDLVELLGKQLDAAKDRQDADAVSSLSWRLGKLLEGRDSVQARLVYSAALDWDPRAKDVLIALEALHEQGGESEQRADVMERRLAIEHGAVAEQLALALASVRHSGGDSEGALRALEMGFKAAPESRELCSKLEAAYREQLEYDKLAELFVTDARSRHEPEAMSERLREAARLYRDELSDPEQGAKSLREARDAAPGNQELFHELVEMLIAAGELAAAVTELSGAIERQDGLDTVADYARRAELLSRRAGLRVRLGQGEGALEDFDEAIECGLVSLRAPLAEHLGTLAMQAAGRGDSNGWRTYRLRMAQLRLELGEIDQARDVLTELLKADSKDKATLRAVAHLDELEGRWDAASATYRRLVGLEDEVGIVSAALKLAETCEKAGRLADARGGLERARMAAPNDAPLRQRLAWLYEALGATRELAELVLEEARASVGDIAPRFEGLMRAGQLFLEYAQDPSAPPGLALNAAIAPLEEAHALRSGDLDCSALLSDAYVASGRFDEALDLLQRTIGTFKGRRARELSALYHRLARIAEVQGDNHAELQHLTTALDMDPQSGGVASELAQRAIELQSLDLAQRALRVITMLKEPAPLPKALAYQHLGEIARQQGDGKRAMMMLKRAIDDDPTLQSARDLLQKLQAEGV